MRYGTQTKDHMGNTEAGRRFSTPACSIQLIGSALFCLLGFQGTGLAIVVPLLF